MKAAEVLKRYAAGERDFRGANLRGQSFKGENLSGADFSGADIRSANFTRARLCGANFSWAKAGLQKRWVTALVLVSWLLSGVVGSLSAFVGALILLAFSNQANDPVEGLITFLVINDIASGSVGLIVMAVVLAVMLKKGTVAAAFAGAIAIAIAGVFAVAAVLAGAFVPIVSGMFVAAITGGFASAFVGACILAVAVAGTIAGTIADKVALLCTLAVAGAGAGAGAVVVAFGLSVVIAVSIVFTLTLAVSIAGTVILTSAYLSWRTLERDSRYAWIRAIAIVFAASGGTRFHNANLSRATFTQATLRNTDLRQATLTLTNWHRSKKLDLARLGGTILLNPKVRALAVTHRGAGQSYKGLELKGLHLAGADLSDADLTEADISNATLEGAWLERANLTKTQALGTNFHQARLTGACVEEWNIGPSTQLEGAICEYVYLLNGQREPQPSSGTFEPGEFAKLFKEVLDTVNLIFRNGLDWRAFITAFKQVQVENEGTELSIQGIDNKGDGVMVVRVNVPPETNKEKIHSDLTHNYEIKLAVLKAEYQLQLQAKEEQIAIYHQQNTDMKEIVGLLASRPLTFEREFVLDRAAKRILILAANPQNLSWLKLDKEVRGIDEGLRRSRYREQFSLQFKLAVQTQDVYRHLVDIQPQIVHFCGHGSKKTGIVLEDNAGRIQMLGGDAIVSMFKPFASRGLECILLNACYSELQADAIVAHIPYVIGMNQEIDDEAATTFAVAFYDALGAGEEIESAFELSCSQLELEEQKTPVLKRRQDRNV